MITRCLLILLLCCSEASAQRISHRRNRLKSTQDNAVQPVEGSKVTMKGTTENGLFTGVSTTLRLSFKAGTKDPVWVVTQIETYDHSDLHGPFLQLGENGDTTSTGQYYRNRYSGEWRMYNHGTLAAIRNYDTLGNYSGWQCDFVGAEQYSHRAYYFDATHYYSWEYAPNGFLRVRGETSARGREGVWYEYLAVGDAPAPADTFPYWVATWRNGQLDGPASLYSKGVLVVEDYFVNHQHNGIVRTYTNGIKRSEEKRVNDRLDSVQSLFCSTGKIQEKWTWKYGKRDGTHTVYDTLTGKPIVTELYSEDLLLNSETRNAKGVLVYQKKLINNDSIYYHEVTYHDNGKKKSDGHFVNGFYSGIYEEWYSNGIKKMSVRYSNGNFVGQVNAWNERGVRVYHTTTDQGYASDDEQVWNDNGVLLAYGTEAYNVQAKKYAPQDLPLFVDYGYQFPTIEFVERSVYSSSRNNRTVPDSTFAYRPISRNAPQFMGGEATREAWFRANLRYPAMEREMSVQGTNYVGFTVNADSTISNVHTIRGVSNGSNLDRELERVVRMMPKWKPATRGGKPVSAQCVMSVHWKLVD